MVFWRTGNGAYLLKPNWPPHAKFHDARSILPGFLLGTSGLYLVRIRSDSPEKNLALCALRPSFLWISQDASCLFPGAEACEAEFPEKMPEVGGVWLNERFTGALMLALIAAGYAAKRER